MIHSPLPPASTNFDYLPSVTTNTWGSLLRDYEVNHVT